METPGINQPTIALIDGIEYDVNGATQETMALIQDLSTIQAEMNRVKVSYDIASLARQAILEKTKSAIATGESGLVEIESESETPATADEV